MARRPTKNAPMPQPMMRPWMARVTALALLGLVVFAIFSLAIQPLHQSYARVDDALEETATLKAKYEGIAASRKALEKQLKTLRARQNKSGFYLEGTTNALAGAALQEKVSSVVEAADGQLRSVQSLPGSEEKNFEKVGVRVQMIVTVEELYDVLYELEAGETFLFVENLDIRGQRSRRRNQDNNEAPELAVRFDLSGFLRPKAS